MRLDSLLLSEKMEASLSVQPQEEGASRIQSSRDDGSGDGVGRGRSVSRARPSWFRRALGGLLARKNPAAVEAPAPALALERAPTTERPRWRSSLKKAVACICKPICSGGYDDDVIVDPRKSRRRRRRRRRGKDIRSGARSPPPEPLLTGESDGYWTFAFRGQGRSSSLTDEMLMRRFVLEEDMARRRMEKRAAAGSWCPPGASRLSQMSLANDDDNGGRSRRE